jgi:hypothetical protein
MTALPIFASVFQKLILNSYISFLHTRSHGKSPPGQNRGIGKKEIYTASHAPYSFRHLPANDPWSLLICFPGKGLAFSGKQASFRYFTQNHISPDPLCLSIDKLCFFW